MQSALGTYILILRNRSRQDIQVGRWGTLDAQPGYYLYVGSAFGSGGLRARVTRHCRKDKPKHWYIDYLRAHTSLTSVWCRHDVLRAEHQWAAALASLPEALPIAGFGCSDCTCKTHLFFMQAKPARERFARRIGRSVEEWCV